MVKPAKQSVAVAIRNQSGQLLTVRRADDDRDLPGLWGLPAVSLRAGETPEQAAIRAGRDKLGVSIEICGLIGTQSAMLEAGQIQLSEYTGRVRSGTPAVPQPDRSVSQYVDLCYTDDLTGLFNAARRGSLCSRIYLDSIGVQWRA